MKIQRFEDIKAWQESRILVCMIYKIVKNNNDLQNDYRFKNQITASSVSVMANIAEGFSRKSNREFAQFLFIAKGSIAELQSHIYVAIDQNYISKDKFNEIYQQTDKIARLISNFITYLLNKRK